MLPIKLVKVGNFLWKPGRYEFAKWFDCIVDNRTILTLCSVCWHPCKPQLPTDIALDAGWKGEVLWDIPEATNLQIQCATLIACTNSLCTDTVVRILWPHKSRMGLDQVNLLSYIIPNARSELIKYCDNLASTYLSVFEYTLFYSIKK